MHGQVGFTLLEMVIAIAIFAVIGAISFTTLNQFISTRDILQDRNHGLSRLQRTFLQFERDVRFMVYRPVRDGLGEVIPAFTASETGDSENGDIAEFTVALPSFKSSEWHTVKRVAWALEEGSLVRRIWPVLDRDFDSKPRDMRLLTGVLSVELNYYVIDKDAHRISLESNLEDDTRLPHGVELIVTLEGDVTYRRVLEIASETI